ncbi:hypothetical protein G9A89_004864 [Geosiphon pyriformis]|nr:hypothetical protein G9A89_004864 [Geosiphon pyriformis]
MLAKGFIPSDWYCKTLDVLGCSDVAGVMHKRSNHQSSMEKASHIVANGSTLLLADNVRDRLSSGVVRLLNINETKKVYSGLCTSCLIFSGLEDMVLVVANL